MDNQTLIVIVAVLLVLVVTGMIAFLVSSGRAAQKQRTLSVIKGAAATETKKSASRAQDARRETIARKLKEAAEENEEDNKKKTLADSIMQAGLDISVRQFWLYSFLFAVIATAIVFLMGKGPFLVATTAVIGFFGVPRFVLRHLTARRQKKFMEDLADVFESMVRLLKAGMPVSEAIKMVSREFTGPVGEEMGRIFDQQKIGVSLADAVKGCAKRVPLTEVQMFATAVSIQAQTGSSLSEVFENLARVVRARFRLKRKVQAVSSEAKASAMIIGALPVLVATAMYFLNREYIEVLFTDRTGKVLLTAAIIWMGVGIVMMRQMINFKV